jgi:hypothetical protein
MSRRHSARAGASRAFGAAVTFIVAACAWSPSARAAGEASDAVVLTDGHRVTGTVYSDVSGEGVKIRLSDGTIRFYPRAAVRRVEYSAEVRAESQTPPPQPPPAQAPPPVAPAVTSSAAPAAPSIPAENPPPPTGSEIGASASLHLDPLPRHVRHENLKPMWVTGLIVDSVLWGVRAALTGVACAAPDAQCTGVETASAAIPVFGGFIELTHADDQFKPALAVSGCFEVAGFVLLVVGLAVHRDVTVIGRAAPSLYVQPAAVRDGGGLTLGGTF